ncbi:MAG TPA: tetratricopeptide repeat protein, partial [Candidatus Edwardsbacteria bacterium]|nr:tetratricopeptide repeat protein [Candidatus Edwardsbacteria bacterium]
EPGLLIPTPEVVGRRVRLSEVRIFMGNAGGGVVTVSGQAGVGKTTFVAEVIRAGGYQQQALTSVMSSTTQTIPYFPFREILRTLAAGEAGASLKALPQPYRLELAKIVPELLRGGRRGPAAAVMVDKYRLFEGVKQALELTNRPAPRILVLDNMHWADQGSLELLQYLGRTLRDKLVYIFLMYREEELPGSPLQAALEALAREANFREIALAPLSESDVARMLALMADAVPPAELIRFIARQTGGNPFFIEEQMKALLDGGALAWQGRRLQFDRGRRVPIPDSVEGLAAQKMKRLDSEAREVVELAAVLGREADFQLLRDIAGLAEGRLFHAMDAILRLKLLVETERERYYFPENLIREAVYGRLTSITSRHCHQRVAQALLQQNRRYPGEAAEELSHHFFHARDCQQAVVYSLEAAERSRTAYANAEAIMYYSRALECLQDQESAGQPAIAAECYIKRAEISSLTGDNSHAITDIKRAIVRARDAGNQLQEAEARMQLGQIYNAMGRFADAGKVAQDALKRYREQRHRRGQALALNSLGSIHVHRNDYPRAIECFTEALVLARAMGDDGLAGRCYNNLGTSYSAIGKAEAASEQFRKAVAIGRDQGHPKLEAQALNNLALELAGSGDAEGGLDHHQRALRIFQQIGDRRGEAICLNNIGLVYLGRFDFTRARNLFQRSLTISREIANQRDEANTLNNIGAIHLEQGETAAAADVLHEALGLAEQIGVRRIEAHVRVNLGYLQLTLGDPTAAAEQAGRAAALWQELGSPQRGAEAGILRGEVALAQRDRAAAERRFQAALDTAGKRGFVPVAADAWLGLAEAAIEADDRAAARQRLDGFTAALRDAAFPEKRARAQCLEGRLQQALGDLHRAEQLLASAAAAYAGLGKKYELAITKYHLGGALAAAGRASAARRALAEARKLFREVGAKAWLSRLRPARKDRSQ